jgi:hypothetical protein
MTACPQALNTVWRWYTKPTHGQLGLSPQQPLPVTGHLEHFSLNRFGAADSADDLNATMVSDLILYAAAGRGHSAPAQPGRTKGAHYSRAPPFAGNSSSLARYFLCSAYGRHAIGQRYPERAEVLISSAVLLHVGTMLSAQSPATVLALISCPLKCH